MASINDLPNELLQTVMVNMHSVDLWRCRRVCRRWLAAVDSLPDAQWRRVCLRERGDLNGERTAHAARARLSWKEMNRSSCLWEHIKQAKIEINALPSDRLTDFRLLDNGALVVLELSAVKAAGWTSKHPSVDSVADTVIYYDLDTFQEIKRETYDLTFRNYYEDDTFIIFTVATESPPNLYFAYEVLHDQFGDDFDFLDDQYGDLYVTLKANGQRYKVGELENNYCNYRVFSNSEILFVNKHTICVAKVVEENGVKSIKVEEKRTCTDTPISFSFPDVRKDNSSDEIFILDEFGKIRYYPDNEFKDTLYDVSGTSPLEIMLAYNFEWTDHYVFKWLLEHIEFSRKVIPPFALGCDHASRCPDAVIFATKTKMKIHVEDFDDKPFMYLRLPDRIIDLKKIISKKYYSNVLHDLTIRKLSVVERRNGHRVIVLTSEKCTELKRCVYVLDLVHNVECSTDEPALLPSEPKRKHKKIKMDHKYNTRSSVKKCKH